LLKNAIESIEETETKGVLKIYSEVKQGAICIYFENNGPLIPEETQKIIFDKFYTTKAKKNGSGLGLSIVKSVLEEHNASISLSSDEEKTTFKLTFTR
jgi:two-component system sensor histidine kinase AtoS